jgi:hypothetical protein
VDIAVSHNGVCHTDIHMRVSPSNRGHDIEARLLINLPQPWSHAPSIAAPVCRCCAAGPHLSSSLMVPVTLTG